MVLTVAVGEGEAEAGSARGVVGAGGAEVCENGNGVVHPLNKTSTPARKSRQMGKTMRFYDRKINYRSPKFTGLLSIATNSRTAFFTSL